ncbi:MAG: STAS domain-containing protein [Streptosporangiaceae bacterium]
MNPNYVFTSETRTTGPNLIFELRGELDVVFAPGLRGQIIGVLRDLKPERLILDLTHLTFLDSTGLGVLLWAHHRMSEQGGRLCLAAPGHLVRRVLHTTGLDRRLHVYDTLEDLTHDLTHDRSDLSPVTGSGGRSRAVGP